MSIGLRLVAVGSFVAVSSTYAADFDAFDTLEGYVFTPAQMNQSVANSPGAVSVIDKHQIKTLGLKTLHDIMRLVPGFYVGFTSPFASVSRGSIDPSPRRLQVLVDGVSEVNPLVGVVNWDVIPVAIERIERVEVVRSQSSSTYGANAFLGTVNFITKKPEDTTGVEGTLSASQKGRDAYIADSQRIGNTAFTVEASTNFYDRFDEFPEKDRTRHDDQETHKGSISTQTKFSDGSDLDLRIAGAAGKYEHQVGQTEYGTNYPTVDLDTLLVSAFYTKAIGEHTIRTGIYNYRKDWDYHWNVCAPKAFFMPELGELFRDNPELVLAALNSSPLPASSPEELQRLGGIFNSILTDPESLNDVCGESNVDYMYDSTLFTITDIWQISHSFRVSSSAQFDRRLMESETYGNGTTKINKSKIFSNGEWTPNELFTVNAGIMAESLGSHLESPQYSPRLGINYHIDQRNTVKVVWSQGKRLIDGIEVIDFNQVPTYFEEPIYGSNRQSGFLGYFELYENKNHVEKIETKELIYENHGEIVSFEARLFREELTNLLNILDFTDPINGEVNGSELVSRFQNDLYDIRLAGHYVDNDTGNTVGYNDYTSKGGSAYFSRKFDNDYTFALSYYGTAAISYSSYDRFDMIISKTFRFGDSEVDLSGILSHHRDLYVRAFDYMLLDGGTVEDVNELTMRMMWKL